MRHFGFSLASAPKMNSTLFDSPEEALGHFFLGGLIFLTYFYAIYLSYAMHDYVNEKPIEEIDPIDMEFKDMTTTTNCLLYVIGFIQFISVFIPPVTFEIVYLITHLSLFLANFYLVSWLVYFYILNLHVFYPDTVKDIPLSTIRFKSFLWKILLTIIYMVISAICPLEDHPLVFQFLTKGKKYDR